MTQEPDRRKREQAAETLERLRERLAGVDDDGWFFAGIAEQVADRRRALGLSQAELAELVATTQSAIARLESGGRPPRIDTLLRIANALDCELLVELRPRTKTKTKPKKRGGK
jgi:ribosome-binding protein aMBF1 (putative translation factor)